MKRPLPTLPTLFSLLAATAFTLAGGFFSLAHAQGETPAAASTGDNAAPVPSLKGKRIGITVAGTDHYWDLKAYQGAVDEVKRLGGTPIALDAGRNDNRQIAQIQTLIAQKPDAI